MESKIERMVREADAEDYEKDEDEQELLEKIFSERMTTSQSKIKRNLNQILTD